MNFNGKRITTVWLDLDDTLIDFKRNSRAALRRLWDQQPVLRTLYPDPQRWIDNYETHNHALWALYSQAAITQPELRIDRFRLPLTDAALPDHEARRLAPLYDTLYLDLLAQEKATIPGAIDLLQALHRRPDIRTGILSNGFKEVQYRKMDRAGITPYIDFTVLSDDIGINKPDPRIFAYAMHRSSQPDPSAHLLIGDNPATDILGALQSGWSALWFNPAGPSDATPPPPGATEVRSLSRIIDIIGRQ